MKQSRKVMDSLISDASREFTDSLIAESVEMLEEQVSAKDAEIAGFKARIKEMLIHEKHAEDRIAELEAKCENMKQYEVKCAGMESALSAQKQASDKVESALRDQLRQLQVEDTKESDEPRLTGIKVNRGADGLSRDLVMVYA